MVQLYLHRGSFETVLADEDVEQGEGRWCSHTPFGQERWQIVSQWVWNLRLELGCGKPQPQLRHTRLVDDTVLPDTAMPTLAPPPAAEPVEEEVIENYGPLGMAKEWAKCRRLRRTWFVGLRRQQVHVQAHLPSSTQPSPPSSPTSPVLLSRAERAHARLSWQERLTRNARTASSTHFHIMLFGVAPQVATYLNLVSVSAGGSSFRSSPEAAR